MVSTRSISQHQLYPTHYTMIASVAFLFASASCALSPTLAFQVNSSAIGSNIARSIGSSIVTDASKPTPLTTMASSTTATTADAPTDENNASKSYLYVPSERDEHYRGNIAKYLLDLDDVGATFDFCGGMMFQLVLSDKLKSHLQTISSNTNNNGDQQPVIHPASQSLMNRTPDYQKSAAADNTSIFHGRELRQIPTANGGMGFVLQLSYADPSGTVSAIDESNVAGKGAEAAWSGEAVDPQGWSSEEIATYDGWRGDSFRQWRKGSMYEAEGFDAFSDQFGKEAFGLNHRFFLHLDDRERMWLSAEDGCEGTPSEGRSLMGKLGGILFGK
mmetsp:Transcript_9983/g.15092  ORF Transcript_9983/g.15092 Transcript_9983/m.15092 type:complete len:331 (+) Transcript_9983:1-993(+)